MNIKNKKGQSTVEYVLLVTAVVAVMIAFATNNTNTNGLQHQLLSTVNGAVGDINMDGWTASHAPKPAPSSAIENTYAVQVNPS